MDRRKISDMKTFMTESFAMMQTFYRKPDDLMQANREVFAYIDDLHQQLDESNRKRIAMENAMPLLIAEVHQSMRGIEKSLDKFRRGSFRPELSAERTDNKERE